MSEGRIHSVETFGSADGPGVRFVIFLQGCDMRCLYCHNADTWDLDSGYIRSADEILDQAERYRGYWGKDGGITVSGGEALLQMDFLMELFREAKKKRDQYMPGHLWSAVHQRGKFLFRVHGANEVHRSSDS